MKETVIYLETAKGNIQVNPKVSEPGKSRAYQPRLFKALFSYPIYVICLGFVLFPYSINIICLGFVLFPYHINIICLGFVLFSYPFNIICLILYALFLRIFMSDQTVSSKVTSMSSVHLSGRYEVPWSYFGLHFPWIEQSVMT